MLFHQVLPALLAILPSLSLASEPVHAPILQTTLGQVSGVHKQVNKHTGVDVFYGIPFAQPPTGDLRFQAPHPAQAWDGIKDGTKRPNSCWQALDEAFNRFRGVEMWNPNTPRHEDCLYLNVWIPHSDNECNKPKTILVWIFGGGFWAGTTTLDIYEGSQLAAQNDVIVVSIAYRLGPLGFLYLGPDTVPGNAGMLDQVMALQWIKDNAVLLGGSPDDISIFGESAGASSVGFHLLSPLSRDLFNYAIMQSSSPLAEWAVQGRDEARDRAVQLAGSVGCDTNHSDIEIVNCLRTADPEVLSNNQWNAVGTWFDVTHAPVVDGNFLPAHPDEMLETGDVKNTSVLIGVNKNEGIYFDIYGFMTDFPLDGSGSLTESQLDTILHSLTHNDEDLFHRVKNEYLRDPDLSHIEVVDAVSGDMLFKCPVVDFAQQYAALGGSVHVYSFEHRLSTNPWPLWMGVAHGYEIELVFGLPLAPDSLYTEREKYLSQEMMAYWTNFAKTGDPNDPRYPDWPRYENGDEEYVVIDTEGTHVSHFLRHHQCAFWNNQTETAHTVTKRDAAMSSGPFSEAETLTALFGTFPGGQL